MRRSTRSGAAAIIASLAVLAVLVVLVGAAGAATGEVAYRERAAGSRGANLPGETMHAVGRVLRTRDGATRLLRRWGLDVAPARQVDFERESMIVVLAEYQPSGGYRARVSSVVRRRGRAVVTAGVRYEGGEMAVQDLERPWVVVTVERPLLAGVGSEVIVRRR